MFVLSSQNGGQLLAIMDTLGVADSPKARDIQQTISDLEGRYDALQEAVVEKQHRLNDAFVSHCRFTLLEIAEKHNCMYVRISAIAHLSSLTALRDV